MSMALFCVWASWVCNWFLCFFIEALDEPPEARGVCAVVDVLECVLTLCFLLLLYVGIDFHVQCLYSGDVVLSGWKCSKVFA